MMWIIIIVLLLFCFRVFLVDDGLNDLLDVGKDIANTLIVSAIVIVVAMIFLIVLGA